MQARQFASSLIVLLAALTLGSSHAQEAPPVEQAKPAARPAVKPAVKPTPKAPATKRRAVYQTVDGMPAPPTYGPRLTPMAPLPLATPAPAPGIPVPGPAVISRCDAGGCFDTAGARYNGASGTLLSPQGRACTNIGGIVTCN